MKKEKPGILRTIFSSPGHLRINEPFASTSGMIRSKCVEHIRNETPNNYWTNSGPACLKLPGSTLMFQGFHMQKKNTKRTTILLRQKRKTYLRKKKKRCAEIFSRCRTWFHGAEEHSCCFCCWDGWLTGDSCCHGNGQTTRGPPSRELRWNNRQSGFDHLEIGLLQRVYLLIATTFK